MDRFLSQLDYGQTQMLYHAFTVFSIAAAVAFNVSYGRAFGIKKRTSFTVTVSIYVLSYILIYAWQRVDELLWGTGSLSSSRIVLAVPVICAFCARFWKLKPSMACEFIGPSFYIARGVAKYGCIFPGCCHGQYCEWGIYSPAAGARCFPLQPIEATGTLVIAVFAVCYSRRQHYQGNGRTYALSLVLFGIFRYIMEFFNTSERVFLQMTDYSFYAIGMALIGLSALYVLDLYERRKRKLLSISKL